MNKKTIISGAAVGILIILLIVGFITINLRLNSLSDELSLRNDVYRGEIDSVSGTMDLVKQNLLLLRQDTNTLRGLLNLPPRDFPELEENTGDSDQETIDRNIIFFSALKTIVDRSITEAEMVAFQDFLISDSVTEVLKSADLTSELDDTGLGAFLKGEFGNEYSLSSVRGELTVKTILGAEEVVENHQELDNFISSQYDQLKLYRENNAAARNELTQLINSRDLDPLMKSREVDWSEIRENPDKIYSGLNNSTGAAIITISYEKTENLWLLGNEDYPNIQSLTQALANYLTIYDPRPAGDIVTDENLNEIRELLDDTGFSAYSDQLEAFLTRESREDHYYYYLDILDNEGDRLGSFAVQKHVGEIYLMDRDDVIITSLKSLALNEGVPQKKKITIPDDYRNTDSLLPGDNDIAFVLIGANEANTDTMMVVNLNEETGRGTILTIPRDLYYNGRKINSIYPTYGADELLKTLSEITGLSVKRHIFIDMFAFADVVDLLGGIDIVLGEPLIDPGYKIKENGKWSTLHYEAGPLHLGGIQALRVARSRHTTSDFGRAERQQMILMALRDRLVELNALDAGKIFELAGVLIDYVKTDFTLLELLNIFANYRNAPFSKHILSWDNVLYNTYSNIYMLEDGVEIDDDFNKGAWILLPVNNDWQVIRWYVNKIITEAVNE